MFSEKNLLLRFWHQFTWSLLKIQAASRQAAFALTFFVRETLEPRVLSPSMFLRSMFTVLVYTNKNYHEFEKSSYHVKAFYSLHEESLVCLKILFVSLNRKQNETKWVLKIRYLTRTINQRCGSTWYYMAIHGHTWQYMAIHGYTWQCMAIHGCTW